MSDPFGDRDFSGDPHLAIELRRLYRLVVLGRWGAVAASWATLGAASLWVLRPEFALWANHFTWVAVRYAIAYNRPAAIALAFCIGQTVSAALWQARNLALGLPPAERERLVARVETIRRQGKTHPLWRWVCGDRPFGS